MSIAVDTPLAARSLPLTLLLLVQILFLVRPTAGAEHPRIFFSKDEIPILRQQADTTHRDICVPILEFAEKNINSVPPAGPPNQPALNPYRNAGNQLLAFAFAYVLTGDGRYLDLTRRYLLAHTKWSHWGDEAMVGGRDLGFHHMLRFNAIAYDWVYNDLSQADRETIRAHLAMRAQESYEASTAEHSYCGNWWRRSYIQNHHWNCHSALGIAALVLEGEDPRAETWLKDAADHLERVRYLLEGIADGTWHEGLPYQSYGMAMSLPFLQNLRRLKGRDLIPHAYYRNYAYWRLYNTLPNSGRFVMSYSDFQWSWGNSYHPPHILRFIAREYRNGHAEWAAQHLLANGGRPSNVWNAPWYVYEFLNYASTVKAHPPDDLPLGRTFPDLAAVIWRTGWTAHDLVFGLKTGAYGGRFPYHRWINGEFPFDRPGIDSFNAGHDHADANTFYLYRGNVDLCSEFVEYGGSETALHNTLLVDGEGQYWPPARWRRHRYWDREPEMHRGTQGRLDVVYETENFNYLIADAANSYRRPDPETGKPGDHIITEFRRHVLFVRPRYLVVVDNVRADSPHRYDWLCHLGSSVSLEGNWVKGLAERDQVLGIKVLAPDNFVAETGDDGKPYVRIRPVEDVAETRFVVVLYPTDIANWQERPMIESLSTRDSAAGIRVSDRGQHDHLFNLRTDETAEIGSYQLQGRVASIARSTDGRVARLFLADGHRLSDTNGSRLLVEGASAHLLLEAVYDGPTLSLYGNNLSGLRIYAPDVDPAHVTLNGQPVAPTRRGDYLALPQPGPCHREPPSGKSPAVADSTRCRPRPAS